MDQGDFAGGTSSRTSRLIHGGIRYLEQGAFRLVFEASRERAILYRIAPHLVRPLPFIFPIYDKTGRSPWTLRAGMILYDLISLFRNFYPHRILSAHQVLQHEPGLSPAGLRGGALFYDAQMNDARLCLAVILSARAAGALALNYTKAEKLLHQDGRVSGILARSLLTGERGEIRAKQVVNATGPWLDRMAAQENPDAAARLRTTRGSHLVVPPITRRHAVVVTSRRDERVFFVMPWGPKTIIGTTDVDFRGDPAEVRCTQSEVKYLLEETNRVFPDTKMTETDIIARYSGVRPLIAEPGVAASEVSRETDVFEGPGGMISIVAGKYTVHRLTGRRVVDRIAGKLSIRLPPARTDLQPLWGGGMSSLEDYLAAEAPRAVAAFKISESEARRLIGIYGTRYNRLLERIARDRSLLEPVAPGEPETRAQILHAVEEEAAVRLSDVLIRRTDLGLSPHRREQGMLEKVSRQMGEILGWDDSRRQEEIDLYLRELN